MLRTISPIRWQLAQEAESLYWERVIKDPQEFLRILHEKYIFLDKIKKIAPNLFEIHNNKGKLLEVGIGPLGIGVACLLEQWEKWDITGIDSLNRITTTNLPEYLENCFLKLTTRLSHYIQVPAEEYRNYTNIYNIIICYNVLDHVNNPFAILNNIQKALIPGGYLLLGIDIVCIFSKYRQQLLYKRYYDRAHPYKLTAWDIQNIIKNAGFEITWLEKYSFETLRRLWSRARRLTAICRKPLEAI